MHRDPSEHDPTVFSIGAAKREITPLVYGIGMMGWGIPADNVEGIETPLHARAVAIQERTPGADGKSRTLILCLADICFVSQSIRQRVLGKLEPHRERLGLDPEWICLSATHTHAAPAGYSHYVLYNILVPGYSEEVLETYASGITEAILAACEAVKPARIRYGKGEAPLSMPVAFNRSVVAWNQNPDCPKVPLFRGAEALDRSMWLLRFDGVDGTPIASWNGFAVHATSVHSHNYKICADNKGYAMGLMEERIAKDDPRAAGFIAGFAQTAAGDVSPNYTKRRGLRRMMGRFRDDYRSARYNGFLQMKLAHGIYEKAAEAEPLRGPLDAIARHFDLTDVDVDPKHANGHSGCRTGKAALGVGFLLGTEEGPGIPRWLMNIGAFMEKTRKVAVFIYRKLRGHYGEKLSWDDEVQGKKTVFIESGERKVLGTRAIDQLIFPRWIHPSIRIMKDLAKNKALGSQPFTPQILPLQILRIGSIAILCAPAEFTTTSGRRTIHSAQEKFTAKIPGISKTLFLGYANAYAGYVTTYEEYQTQRYEGASTHFGKWTLAGYQTLFDRLIEAFSKPSPKRKDALPDLTPHVFSQQELLPRCFQPPENGKRLTRL